MNIALLGGTFNPVHNGHLLLADQVRKTLNYDKIIFIPSYLPAHKSISGSISAEERLHMLKIALENYSWADFSDCEIERKGISYTFETLKFIRKKYKLNGKPGLIIGDDLAEGFSNWRNPHKILEVSDLIIAHRLYAHELKLDFPHTYINNDIYELSSSEIRDLLKQGKSIGDIIPVKVAEYIRERDFYGKNS